MAFYLVGNRFSFSALRRHLQPEGTDAFRLAPSRPVAAGRGAHRGAEDHRHPEWREDPRRRGMPRRHRWSVGRQGGRARSHPPAG